MRNEMVESFILDIIDYKESWKDVSFLIQTFNQHVVKQRNKSLILHAIKDSYPISRATLASETGLNKGTVSSLVSELLDEKSFLNQDQASRMVEEDRLCCFSIRLQGTLSASILA